MESDEENQRVGGGQGSTSEAQPGPGSSRADIELQTHPIGSEGPVPGGPSGTESEVGLAQATTLDETSTRSQLQLENPPSSENPPSGAPSAPEQATIAPSTAAPHQPPPVPVVEPSPPSQQRGLPAAQIENIETVIDWAENDPENPLNWSKGRKFARILLSVFQSMMVQSACFLHVPSFSVLRSDPGVDGNLELVGFLLSLYLVGFAAGPLLWRPLSRYFGSTLVDLATGMLFMIVMFRPSAPCPCRPSSSFGSSPGSSVAAFWPMARPSSTTYCRVAREDSIGLCADKDRWQFLVLIPGAGVGVAVMLLGILLFCVDLEIETYGPVVLEAKVTRLRNRNNNRQFRSALDGELTSRQNFKAGALEPLKALYTDQKCLLYAILFGLAAAVHYYMLTTMDYVLLGAHSTTHIFIYAGHIWLFCIGCCAMLVGCGASDQDMTYAALEPRRVQPRGVHLKFGGASTAFFLALYGWVARTESAEGVIAVLLFITLAGVTSTYFVWCTRKAMESSFTGDGSSYDVAVAHAACAIVLAVFGGLFSPFTLLMVNSADSTHPEPAAGNTYHPGPTAGNTSLVGIWAVLGSIVYFVLQRQLGKEGNGGAGGSNNDNIDRELGAACG
ncbi:hypothetical protein F5144DRAFT_605937 [Chaetomium tenue]|uniref:Uncharacterized protein n=1 Tax=Chaetomium tenue TaxID=1854479 RepID=A0ACB7P0S2_9PEZI|nr:hypothetical protein F5144DRAFT_605937 [Chaetomium globosum]